MARLATDDQVQYINVLLEKGSIYPADALEDYGVEEAEKLTRAQALKLIDELEMLLGIEGI